MIVCARGMDKRNVRQRDQAALRGRPACRSEGARPTRRGTVHRPRSARKNGPRPCRLTTQDTAVGRKYTERKEPPRRGRARLSSAAMGGGMPDREWESTASSARVCSNARRRGRLSEVEVNVLGPRYQWAVSVKSYVNRVVDAIALDRDDEQGHPHDHRGQWDSRMPARRRRRPAGSGGPGGGRPGRCPGASHGVDSADAHQRIHG